MHPAKRIAAEFFGTFWLVFGGCGSAVLAAAFPALGIGFVGVALAFGLTVLTMAFAIGHISGCHLNPAVSVGLAVGKRFPWKDLPGYVIAQVAGGAAGAAVLWLIASGKPGFVTGGFASNGYSEHSPGGYSLLACFVAEVVLTAFFLLVILGSTDERAPKGFAPIAIGLGLTLIHLISIPVTNTSVNCGCDLCRRLGAAAALAVLGRADPGRNPGRICLRCVLRHSAAADPRGDGEGRLASHLNRIARQGKCHAERCAWHFFGRYLINIGSHPSVPDSQSLTVSFAASAAVNIRVPVTRSFTPPLSPCEPNSA
jgi:aquaporin Z